MYLADFLSHVTTQSLVSITTKPLGVSNSSFWTPTALLVIAELINLSRGFALKSLAKAPHQYKLQRRLATVAFNFPTKKQDKKIKNWVHRILYAS
jgi:hypothetical protein